jgi:hypothetical protein
MTSLYVFSKAGFDILIINLDDPSVDYATRARIMALIPSRARKSQ